MNEASIPAPVNPLTLKLNLTILRYVSSLFSTKWLPALERVVTSDLRTASHNKDVGGVENSTHVHGLAEDFQLKYKGNGSLLSESQARAVYDQFIAPNWPGFTEFEKSSSGEGYHIHWQLSREVSTYAGLITVAGIGVVGFALIKKMGEQK